MEFKTPSRLERIRVGVDVERLEGREERQDEEKGSQTRLIRADRRSMGSPP